MLTEYTHRILLLCKTKLFQEDIANTQERASTLEKFLYTEKKRKGKRKYQEKGEKMDEN